MMETIHTFLNEKDYHIKGFSLIVKKNFSQISWVSLHGSCFLGVNIFAIECKLIQCTQFLEIFLIIQRLLTFSKVLLMLTCLLH